MLRPGLSPRERTSLRPTFELIQDLLVGFLGLVVFPPTIVTLPLRATSAALTVTAGFSARVRFSLHRNGADITVRAMRDRFDVESVPLHVLDQPWKFFPYRLRQWGLGGLHFHPNLLGICLDSQLYRFICFAHQIELQLPDGLCPFTRNFHRGRAERGRGLCRGLTSGPVPDLAMLSCLLRSGRPVPVQLRPLGGGCPLAWRFGANGAVGRMYGSSVLGAGRRLARITIRTTAVKSGLLPRLFRDASRSLRSGSRFRGRKLAVCWVVTCGLPLMH